MRYLFLTKKIKIGLTVIFILLVALFVFKEIEVLDSIMEAHNTTNIWWTPLSEEDSTKLFYLFHGSMTLVVVGILLYYFLTRTRGEK